MDDTSRTLVASVLFLDIADYSTMGVGDQLRSKQDFNAVLLEAIEPVPAEQRVIADTGDGAAVTVLDDPERALFVAIAVFDNIGDLRVRAGVNLGPVSLLKDINGQANVIGDGINVAQRVMDFAKEGELLVSRSFHEVVTRMDAEYASIFSRAGSRTDKHGRRHDVYAVLQGVRVGRRMAEVQARLAARRAPGAEAAQTARATVSDAGSHLIVSGYSEARVQEALAQLAAQGRRVTSPLSRIGNKWFASVDKPENAEAAVQPFGLKRLVSGATRESVEAKLRELQEYGAVVVREVEFADGVWTAVCEQT